MGKPSRPSQEKRKRELAQKERHQHKEELRIQRKDLKRARDESIEDGVDPDLIGIVPGPQPPLMD